MEDRYSKKLDKFEREMNFMGDNAVDFTAASPGKTLADQISALIVQIKQFAAQQISGADDMNQHFENKQDAYDDLLEILFAINRAAIALSDEIPNMEEKFRLPRNRTQKNMLAAARSFHADAVPYKTNFVAYDLSADFLDDMQELIDAVDSFDGVAHTAGISRGEATASIIEACRQGMILSDKLDAVVRNKYRNNPAKLAAWTIASHLERLPKRKKDSTQPTA